MSRSSPTSLARSLRRSRWTPDDARVVLDALDTSGLSVAAFAREHDLDYQRLHAWRRRLATTTPRATAAPVAFVELPSLTAPASAPPRYELVLPDGAVLRVEGAVDPAAVGALLAVLRAGTGGC